MNSYNFDNNRLSSNYNTLLELYKIAPNNAEKVKIYSQLDTINKYLAPGKYPKLSRPIKHKEYIEGERIKRRDIFRVLEKQTRELCNNWKYSIEDLPILIDRNRQIFKHKEELNSKLLSFFNTVIPEDKHLVEDALKDKRVKITKTVFFPSADIIYLESIKEYYIKIAYNKKLTDNHLGYLIHEFGHASVYTTNGKWQSYDYILEEVIACLYELLFIDYRDKDKNEEIRLSNIRNYFKSVGVYYLFNYFETVPMNNKLYEEYLDIVITLYANIISLELFSRRNEKDFSDSIKYMKENFSSRPAFDILKDIDITEEDLINTSRNIKTKVLSK